MNHQKWIDGCSAWLPKWKVPNKKMERVFVLFCFVFKVGDAQLCFIGLGKDVIVKGASENTRQDSWWCRSRTLFFHSHRFPWCKALWVPPLDWDEGPFLISLCSLTRNSVPGTHVINVCRMNTWIHRGCRDKSTGREIDLSQEEREGFLWDLRKE